MTPTTLEELAAQVGQQREGRVTRVVSVGAFVDVGGVDGLVHVDDMSWRGEKDPTRFVQVGQQVTVSIVSVDLAARRLSLSMRRDEDDPWRRVAAKLRVGGPVRGTVLAGPDGAKGVFFALEPYVDAFVHESDLEEGASPAHYEAGQLFTLFILAIDVDRRRISASLRAGAPARRA